MSIFTILTLSVGLAMDAFAVAICKGLALKKMSIKKALIIGGYFGFFQGAMPIIGYSLGITFKNSISACDHWIAFGLLGLIGISMIREAMSKEEENVNDSVAFKTMVVLALATSIDALAIGVTFAIIDAPIIQAASLIAIITFLLSMVGVKIGHVFGIRYKAKAEFAGGIVLIVLGFKILFEHLGLFA